MDHAAEDIRIDQPCSSGIQAISPSLTHQSRYMYASLCVCGCAFLFTCFFRTIACIRAMSETM